MDELPGILLIGVIFCAIAALVITRLLIRRVREYLRKRNAVRRSAPAEIAGALAEAAQPLAECAALLVQLGIKRGRLNDRRAASLANAAKTFDQSIFALHKSNEKLISEHWQLTRESEAVYLHRRTHNLKQLSAQSKNLIFRALQLKREVAELHFWLLAEINAAPRNVATESRQINVEIDAALAGPINALQVKHGVQGKRMYRALYRVTRAREIFATLPASFWNSEVPLDPAALLSTDVDAADVVNRYYGKYARAAIQRMSDWLASIRAIDDIHAKALAAYHNSTAHVTAALEQHPDQSVADEWSTLPPALTAIARQLSHIELDALNTLTQQARACEARIRAISEKATSVGQTADAVQRIHSAGAFRDEQWRAAALHIARRLQEFEPGNFPPRIDITMLPGHIEALHADWRAIVGGKIGSWEDWQRLAPTIRRFTDLNTSLTKRLDLASHELERASAHAHNLDARLGEWVDGLQSLSAHPDDRRTFSTLRKQVIALRDRLQRVQHGHGLLNDVARRVADFEASARSALQDVCQRRFGECQKITATLSEHIATLAKHATLNYDEPLAKARATLSEFHALALSKSDNPPSLIGDAVSLSQTASDLSGQARALGQWVQRINETLTQIERCSAETAALEEQRTRAAATLLSWIDYSRQDALLAELSHKCAQAATNRQASSSLELMESRLSQELAAHQAQLEETHDQVELFIRIQDLKHEESAKYESLSAALGDTSPELLRIFHQRNPGPFTSMSATDAETFYHELIAEIDAEQNRRIAKATTSAPVAADAKLQQTLARLQWMCEGGISDGMPLRDMDGGTREAKYALARTGHKSPGAALPHLRRVKSLWLEAKSKLAEVPDQRIRDRYQRRLNDMRSLINQALRSSGADKSEYS